MLDKLHRQNMFLIHMVHHSKAILHSFHRVDSQMDLVYLRYILVRDLHMMHNQSMMWLQQLIYK